MTSNSKVGGFDSAVLIRRLLFFVLLFGLVFFYLILTFNGLTAAKGIEQAQIGREIARGNNSTTKVIRPAAVWQAEKNEKEKIDLTAFHDTYHSPLNPYVYGAVLKAIGGDDFEKFQMKESKTTVYALDRVIASVSVILFLIAVGINYLLISRVFDIKIAGVTALLMILSDLMWQFTQTGLPQMLMLLLFSCALFFIYRALEASIENRVAIGSILTAAIFLSLLALSHWLTIWITLGFVIYAAFFFRPKGISGFMILGVLLLFSLYFVGKNMEWTGNPGGTAFLTLYGGLAESESGIMRTSDPGEQTFQIVNNLNSFLINTSANMLRQVNQLYNNLGSILVAPLFFFALLHPFKREAIAKFRWIILLMWIMGTLGMAIFGLSVSSLDPNQLHILFTPIMSAYGLAFVSILWARIELPAGSALMKYGHFVIVVIISAGPLILTIPRGITDGLKTQARAKTVWPPYWPSVFSKTLHDATEEDEIIFSDQPWAVAWYADRISIWLPRKVEEFEDLELLAEGQELLVAGIVVTPMSFKENGLFSATPFGMKEDFAALMLDGPARDATREALRPGALSMMTPNLSQVMAKYPEVNPIFYNRIFFYSRQRLFTR
ncbi:MAG: hypothetical protein ABF379_14145 [Akkermansiaceae bacterium]